jgi:hypothetical protein
MPYMGEGRNFMLDKLAEKVKALGLLEGKAISGTWSGAAGGVLTCTASHGLADKDIVVFAGLTGGAGLVNGRPYRVKVKSVTEVELFFVEALTEKVEWTSSASAGTGTKLVEVSETRAEYGGAGKSLASEGGAAVNGVVKSTTTHTIAVTAPCSYEYVGFWSATSAGTLYAIAAVTKETISASSASVEIKESQLELDAVA